MTAAPDEPPRKKRKGPKGPNPLSVKKKKVKVDENRARTAAIGKVKKRDDSAAVGQKRKRDTDGDDEGVDEGAQGKVDVDIIGDGEETGVKRRKRRRRKHGKGGGGNDAVEVEADGD